MRSSTSSSRPLLLLVAFVLLLVAGDRLIAYAAERVMLRSHFRYAELYAGRVDAEIAVVGNSRGVHAFFAPELARLTCRPVANMAFNGNSIAATRALGEDLIERDPALEVLIVEVSTVFNDEANDLQLSPFESFSERIAEVTDSQRDSLLPWNEISNLSRLNSELLLRSLFYLRGSDQGWINRRGPIPQTAVDAVLAAPPNPFELEAEAVAGLRALIDAARTAGVEVIAVAAPYHRSVYARDPGGLTWPGALHTALGEDVTVLDLTASLDDDALFTDPYHTNIEGAHEVALAVLRFAPGLAACGD